MADRSITTTLRLNVADFKANARAAGSSLEELVKKGDKSGQVASTFMGRLAQSVELQRQSWDTASTAMLGWGAAATAVVGSVVATYAKFDQAMSNVQAATRESAENMADLREAAIQAGADTQYSATEAAGAIEELAKAGVSTADILNGGLNGALSLAAAGGLAVADAAGIAAVALTQFKLKGSDVGHVADLLAAGAGKAMGDVSDLGMALKQSGLVANQTGLSIEETTGALSAFASAGLLGSDAGTSFKSMLQRLTPQSTEAKNLMDELGISAYDTQGNFIGLTAFAGNLHDSLKDLTVEQRNSAMATIFGSDAVRAASVIYDEGSEGVQEWIDKVNDSGYAAETAAARMDNLMGDWENFTGSVESVVLKSGTGVNDLLREMVQGAENLVDAIGEIPTPVLEAGVELLGFVGIGGLVVGGSMKMVTATYDTIKAFQELKDISPGVSSALGKVGKAAGVVGAVLAGLEIGNLIIDQFGKVPPELEKTTNALLDFAEGGTALDEIFTNISDQSEMYSMFDGLSGAIDRLVNPTLIQRLEAFSGEIMSFGRRDGDIGRDNIIKQFNAMGESLAIMVQSGNGEQAAEIYADLSRKWVNAGGSLETLNAEMPAYQEALKGVANESELASDGTDQFASSSLEAADAAQAQASAIQDLIDAQEENANSMLGLRGAQREWVTTLSDANETIAANGQNLDLSTEAGRANQAALDDIAQSGLSLVDSMYQARDANGNLVYSQEEVKAAMEDARAKFIEAAIAAGYGADEAAVLADNLGLIPGTYTAKVEVADGASRVVSEIQTRINNLTGKSVDVVVNYLSNGNIHEYTAGYGGGTQVKAEGGAIYGPGTGTSDSIPAMLSNGEHVVTAREVQNLGGQHAMYALRSAIRTQPGTLRAALGFASGGAVGISREVPVPIPVPAAAATGGAPIGDLYVTITNPFTGEEIEQKVDGRLLVAKRRSGR